MNSADGTPRRRDPPAEGLTTSPSPLYYSARFFFCFVPETNRKLENPGGDALLKKSTVRLF